MHTWNSVFGTKNGHSPLNMEQTEVSVEQSIDVTSLNNKEKRYECHKSSLGFNLSFK